MKVLLILSDGVRPDSLENIDFIEGLKNKSTYCMNATTVMPSVTLPCHVSLFHSIDPSRHGTTTNEYAPQVRPVSGLAEQLFAAKKKCAMFYDWEKLRDLTRPDSISYSEFISGPQYTYAKTTPRLCRRTAEFLNEFDMDFTFLYLGWTDEVGHRYGWMSKEYMYAVRETCNMIEVLLCALKDEYTVIFTADHGGHERNHGTDMTEDMTIPMFFCGEPFEKGKALKEANIKDIAPTIVRILDAEPADEWEGQELYSGCGNV